MIANPAVQPRFSVKGANWIALLLGQKVARQKGFGTLMEQSTRNEEREEVPVEHGKSTAIGGSKKLLRKTPGGRETEGRGTTQVVVIPTPSFTHGIPVTVPKGEHRKSDNAADNVTSGTGTRVPTVKLSLEQLNPPSTGSRSSMNGGSASSRQVTFRDNSNPEDGGAPNRLAELLSAGVAKAGTASDDHLLASPGLAPQNLAEAVSSKAGERLTVPISMLPLNKQVEESGKAVSDAIPSSDRKQSVEGAGEQGRTGPRDLEVAAEPQIQFPQRDAVQKKSKTEIQLQPMNTSADAASYFPVGSAGREGHAKEPAAEHHGPESVSYASEEIGTADKRQSQPVAFHSLRLTEHMAGPELQFTWHSTESGDIHLSTSLRQHDVEMVVNTERADTAVAMKAELPALDTRLHEHALRLGEVNIVAQERSVATGPGMMGHGREHREWNAPSNVCPEPVSEVAGEKNETLSRNPYSDGRVSVLV